MTLHLQGSIGRREVRVQEALGRSIIIPVHPSRQQGCFQCVMIDSDLLSLLVFKTEWAVPDYSLANLIRISFEYPVNARYV